jgi:hypothetical protein
MAQIQPSLIAARLRRLIGGERSRLNSLARELGVSEPALLMSIDEVAPQPSLEVIVAVVRRYGVDPTWLMTGEYNAARHRDAIGDEEAVSGSTIADFVGQQLAMLSTIESDPPENEATAS